MRISDGRSVVCSSDLKDSNIVLIGPMGACKSALGRRIASHFGLHFVDTDALIEQRTGTSIPIIFDVEGEDGFRAREKAVIAEVCALHGQVIATGGGAVLDVENQCAIKRSEEHTSELQSLMRISYAVFCL